ncbi:MAG TPA: hypothetical protein PKA63_07680 [Oligoflexia bacterium]|nr:hypothetical protein [Oligoflexia bacterium]HMP48529.1 hypothetical protein [Oligoflexia bacterium]
MIQTKTCPSYNIVVSGLRDVLIYSGRFPILSSVMDYVPALQEMTEKERTRLRERWNEANKFFKENDTALTRLIYVALTEVEKFKESPFDAFTSDVPNYKTLKVFWGMNLAQAILITSHMTRKQMRLFLPFLEGEEKELLISEIKAISDLITWLAEKYNEEFGEPFSTSGVYLEFFSKTENEKADSDRPLREVEKSLIPILYNTSRIIELLDSYQSLGFFDFDVEHMTPEEIEWKSPLTPEKKEALMSQMSLRSEREQEFLRSVMELMAKSPNEPLLPLFEVKMDFDLCRLHKLEPTTYKGLPIGVGYSITLHLNIPSIGHGLTWRALMDIVVRAHPENENLRSWTEKRLERIGNEEEVVVNFINSFLNKFK